MIRSVAVYELELPAHGYRGPNKSRLISIERSVWAAKATARPLAQLRYGVWIATVGNAGTL